MMRLKKEKSCQQLTADSLPRFLRNALPAPFIQDWELPLSILNPLKVKSNCHLIRNNEWPSLVHCFLGDRRCLPAGEFTLTANINHKKEEKFATPHFFLRPKKHRRNLDNQNDNLKKVIEPWSFFFWKNCPNALLKRLLFLKQLEEIKLAKQSSFKRLDP